MKKINTTVSTNADVLSDVAPVAEARQIGMRIVRLDGSRDE